ncbi:hypothetical protein J6590_050052 [Homalodisca vitripennis]|nr:hypothetical protein J6590_050052 [Homalodisca vitripennis]
MLLWISWKNRNPKRREGREQDEGVKFRRKRGRRRGPMQTKQTTSQKMVSEQQVEPLERLMVSIRSV